MGDEPSPHGVCVARIGVAKLRLRPPRQRRLPDPRPVGVDAVERHQRVPGLLDERGFASDDALRDIGRIGGRYVVISLARQPGTRTGRSSACVRGPELRVGGRHT